MNNFTFDQALDNSLQMLANGASLAQCLARFPQHANSLAPLLEAAVLAHTGLSPAIPKPNLARGKARFLQAAHPRPASTSLVLRLALAAVLTVIFITAGGVGLTYASASALPGDALYPVKLALAQVELAITFDPQEREFIEAQQAALRRLEAQTAAAQGRQVEIAFEGVVEERRDDHLIVSGLTVRAADAEVQIGDRIEIEARILNGEIVVERIVLVERPMPTPTVVRPNSTPEPTRPVRPSPTLFPTRPAEIRPSPTPTDLRPVSTPTDSRPAIRTTQPRPTATQTSTPVSHPSDGRITATPGSRP